MIFLRYLCFIQNKKVSIKFIDTVNDGITARLSQHKSMTLNLKFLSEDVNSKSRFYILLSFVKETKKKLIFLLNGYLLKKYS